MGDGQPALAGAKRINYAGLPEFESRIKCLISRCQSLQGHPVSVSATVTRTARSCVRDFPPAESLTEETEDHGID